MYSKGEEFKSASLERREDLIKIDALNLLIGYLSGTMSYDEMHREIGTLAKFGVIDEQDLIEFLNNKILYEGYQVSIGGSKDEKELIKKRIIAFKGEL